MPDYNFERLSPKDFERLANALGSEHIARGLRIFGSGTDGGREATYEGKMKYPSEAAPWDGYLVVQCKQKESRGKTPKEEGQWALAQLDAEMAKYKTAKKQRRTPDYFLFITNAQLSAQLATGGKDKLVERLQHWVAKLGSRGADIWDRDKLSNLLDMSPKIAQRFGMLHDGDLIHHAATATLAHRDGIETTLSLFLQEELRADQFVNLAQAGHTNDDRTPLARVFVDLQAVVREAFNKEFYVVAAVQQASDRAIHPSLLAQEQAAAEEAILEMPDIQASVVESGDATETESEEEDDEEEYDDETEEPLGAEEQAEWDEVLAELPKGTFTWYNPARFVIVGGPGQGKSTLAQQLAQRHRAALLKANATKPLEAETARILRVIAEAADEAGSGLPQHPRWPFRVILEQFADKLATGEIVSVLDYIAFLIRKRTKRAFDQQDAEQLLAAAPWFVVFDGLDEVPAVSNRAEVLAAVNRFLLEAHEQDADLLVVATTRPQGYDDDFGKSKFNHLNLSSLSKTEALTYASKFVATKYAADSDRRERIMQRLETAAQEEAIARLMQTPLQVTIMAALVDLVGNPPRERYLLFNRYYEIVYQREQERGLQLSHVLARYRSGIEILHDRIGLMLQIEAESAGKSQSRISRVRLEGLIHNYLVAEELTGSALAQTTADFMDVALHRLVFIAPLEDERYGFEVRSLQEFSAARALMRGDYSVIKNRLRSLAPMPYWRNTVLFAIGKAFAEQNEPLCDMITLLCRELNDAVEDAALSCTLAGSRLALDIIEDGVVDWRPRYRRLFFETAMHLLHLPHPQTAVRLAKLFTPKDEVRYVQAIKTATNSQHAEVQIGLGVVLAVLAKRDDASWAEELLQQAWPQKLEEEQALLSQISGLLRWNTWSLEMVQRVARQSSIAWVGRELRGVPVKWIQDAPSLRNSRDFKTTLVSKGAPFLYHIPQSAPSKEVLDRVAHASPTYYDWQPYLVGRNFLLYPTPEALAETLEAMAEVGHFAVDAYYPGVPWQLAALLNYTPVADELRYHAHRAKRGELGTAQDWQDAETRWENHGFTADDLTAFDDKEWPFTAAIAQKGILPMLPYSSPEPLDDGAITASALLAAFAAMPSKRYRFNLAASIFFFFGHTYNPQAPFLLPAAAVADLATATDWQVRVSHILSVLDIETDWVAEVESLDAIGNHISSLSGYENWQPEVIAKRDEVASQLLPLVGKKKVREGILRFLAALAMSGAPVAAPDINPSVLSPKGQLALIALNLFGYSSTMESEVLAALMLRQWTFKNIVNGVQELRSMLLVVLENTIVAIRSAAVLTTLYNSPIIDIEMKQKIVESLLSQVQLRSSGMKDPSRKTEFTISWLFEEVQ